MRSDDSYSIIYMLYVSVLNLICLDYNVKHQFSDCSDRTVLFSLISDTFI